MFVLLAKYLSKLPDLLAASQEAIGLVGPLLLLTAASVCRAVILDAQRAGKRWGQGNEIQQRWHIFLR